MKTEHETIEIQCELVRFEQKKKKIDAYIPTRLIGGILVRTVEKQIRNSC